MDNLIAFKDGTIAEEAQLPFPMVFYPGFYGAFMAFAIDRQSFPVFCSCTELAILNFVEFKKTNPPVRYSIPTKEALLDSNHFPEIIAHQSVERPRSIHWLTFKEGLCHRCNMITPSRFYCHPMYGTAFIQQYGWYVNQEYYTLGIEKAPTSTGNYHINYLPDRCPTEIIRDIEEANKLTEQYLKEDSCLKEIASGPARSDITPDEVTYWRNVRDEDAVEMVRLRRASSKAVRKVTKRVEDEVRQAFGFKKVGEGWVSETILFHLVESLFPGREVLFHHHPDWLGGLELDVFVAECQLAFEYQGIQHYRAVNAWGGEAALKKVQEHDRRKQELCRKQGARLICIKYTDPLTAEFIRTCIGRV